MLCYRTAFELKPRVLLMVGKTRLKGGVQEICSRSTTIKIVVEATNLGCVTRLTLHLVC